MHEILLVPELIGYLEERVERVVRMDQSISSPEPDGIKHFGAK
jgi:hypothetical protein